MTIDEIRAAMEWARTRDDIDIANEPAETAHHMDTLAACVRELYGALREYHDIWPDIDHEANAGTCNACAVINRYRYALEGDNDD